MSKVTVWKESSFDKLIPRAEERGISQSKAREEFYFASQLINRNKKLQTCPPASVLNSVFEAMNLGLSLNPALKFGYIIPRYKPGIGVEAEYQPSYQGLAHLAMKEGIKNMNVQIVYENDDFEIDLGSSTVKHSPCLTGDRGKIIGGYGRVIDAHGLPILEWMPVSDAHKIREKSDGYQAFVAGKIKSNPWDEWFDEMFRKAIVRRLFKYVNKPQDSALAMAIEIDEREYKASNNQLSYIEGLVKYAEIPEHEKDEILVSLDEMSAVQASKTIKYLKDNQLPPEHRGDMSAAEIREAIQNKLNDPTA